MECREIRDLAEAYVSEQVLVETAQAIVAHLDRCPRCHAEVEGLQRLRASVRSAYLSSRDLSPTPAFVGALHSRLRAEAVGAQRVSLWRHRWLAVAATVVLVIGGGFGFRGLGVSGFTSILQAAVGDHRYCLVTFRLTERPIELEKAAQLYNDPVDRSLESVQPASDQLSGGPIRILERHSCVYHGRRFAHIVVRYKGALTSLVVTPDERLLRHLPGASAPPDGSIVTIPPVDGFQVAAFRGPHHVVFVISTLADDDVREVARSMAGSISRAMKAT
jgi:Putative zinc-finger